MGFGEPKIVFETKDHRVVQHPDRGLKFNSTVGYVVEKSKGKDAMGQFLWEEMPISRSSVFNRDDPPPEETKMVFDLCSHINRQNDQIARLEKKCENLMPKDRPGN